MLVETRAKIKPCAHCGGKAELWEDMGGYFVVECRICGIRTLSKPKKEAVIEDWNRREKE